MFFVAFDVFLIVLPGMQCFEKSCAFLKEKVNKTLISSKFN
jgi:hypothetical protein